MSEHIVGARLRGRRATDFTPALIGSVFGLAAACSVAGGQAPPEPGPPPAVSSADVAASRKPGATSQLVSRNVALAYTRCGDAPRLLADWKQDVPPKAALPVPSIAVSATDLYYILLWSTSV